MSEKNAEKDAAFEAYVSLYNAGLINYNLLPLLKHNTSAEVSESLSFNAIKTLCYGSRSIY